MAIDMLAMGCLGVKESPSAYYFIVSCYCQPKNEKPVTSVELLTGLSYIHSKMELFKKLKFPVRDRKHNRVIDRFTVRVKREIP